MDTKNRLVYRIVLTALLAALVAAMTMLRIPVPLPVLTGAYIHPGDCMVYAAAWMLGPLGAVSAGIGSLIADLLAGAGFYAPATLVIKALMALITAGLLKILGDRFWARLTAMLTAAVFMVAGYAVYEWLGVGFSVMLASLPFNFVQALAGVAIALPLLALLERIPQVNEIRSARGGRIQ